MAETDIPDWITPDSLELVGSADGRASENERASSDEANNTAAAGLAFQRKLEDVRGAPFEAA